MRQYLYFALIVKSNKLLFLSLNTNTIVQSTAIEVTKNRKAIACQHPFPIETNI